MINDKLIDVFLQHAEKEDLIRVIKQILNHFKIENEYQFEEIVNNIVNIIAGDKLVAIKDIDIELIKANISNFTYNSETIDKDSIEMSDIDNIDNTIKITYKREYRKYDIKNPISLEKYTMLESIYYILVLKYGL